MYAALARLQRLTKLTLLEFDLTRPKLSVTDKGSQKELKFTPLPQVTELTIVKTNCRHGLFSTFRYRTDANDRLAPSDAFQVNQFLGVLFERFPNLRSLTIVGKVYRPVAVERALREATANMPLTLVLWFDDKPTSDERHREYQYARKCVEFNRKKPHLNKYPIYNLGPNEDPFEVQMEP